MIATVYTVYVRTYLMRTSVTDFSYIYSTANNHLAINRSTIYVFSTTTSKINKSIKAEVCLGSKGDDVKVQSYIICTYTHNYDIPGRRHLPAQINEVIPKAQRC